MSEQRQQLVEDLKTLLQQDVTAIKDQVEHIKNQFYRLYHEELEAAQKEAENQQEQPSEESLPEPDVLEEQFRDLLSQYKTMRAEEAAKQAKLQEENLLKKQKIVEEMKTLAEGETDGVMANLQRMRELQTEWKTIGPVAPDKLPELRKAYQLYQEQFYDLVKINIELRDLDFKKNLEMKTLLCEAAEKLQNNENIVEASRALQQLHDEWAEIGPVARDLREDLWNRFKAASTVINKKHQAYFDQLHAKEQENLVKKQAIVEQIREINKQSQTQDTKWNNKNWDEAAAKIQTLQNEWRTIGFAPKKYNQSVYDEYRAECDKFFQNKTVYFKAIRDAFNENLQKKRALLEKAKNLLEQLKTDDNTVKWNELADSFRAMQTEWKTIGPVARKYSDDLWQEFSTTCDDFFNARRENIKAERNNALQRKENAKAKFNKQISNAEPNRLYKLRDSLMQEIKTAENNILFFTAKSKSANKLVDDMQRKIDELKNQLADIQNKIKESEN